MDLNPQHFPWVSLSWEEESFIISRGKRRAAEERVLQEQLMPECCQSSGWSRGSLAGLQEALPVVVPV